MSQRSNRLGTQAGHRRFQTIGDGLQGTLDTENSQGGYIMEQESLAEEGYQQEPGMFSKGISRMEGWKGEGGTLRRRSEGGMKGSSGTG